MFDCLALKEEVVGYKLLGKSKRQDQPIKKSFCQTEYHTGTGRNVKWAGNWSQGGVDEQTYFTVGLRALSYSKEIVLLFLTCIDTIVNETPNMFVFQISYLEAALATHLISIPKLKEQIVNLEAEVSAQDKILK